MQFTIDRNKFADLLKIAAAIASRKASMPILSCIYVEAKKEGPPTMKDGQIIIMASNLDMGLRMSIECDVAEPGVICLPAKLLNDIVSVIPGEFVNVSCDDLHVAKIQTSPDHRFTVHGLPADEFPTVTVFDENLPWGTVTAASLHGMIRQTIYAVSAGDLRLHLNGAYLSQNRHPGDSGLRMVATDGHCLATAYRTAVQGMTGLQEGPQAIIPRNALQEIYRILDKRINKEDSVIKIVAANGTFYLSCTEEGFGFSCRLIDAEYPDWRRVVPEKFANVITINRNEFLSALRRLSIMTDQELYLAVVLSVQRGKPLLHMRTNHPDIGEAEESLAVAFPDSTSQLLWEEDVDDLKVSFNIRLLINSIEAIGEDEIILDLREAAKPARIMGASAIHEEDALKLGGLGVIMPLKL